MPANMQMFRDCVPCFTEFVKTNAVLKCYPEDHPHAEHRRIVVISIGTNNYHYSRYAPIAALIWQNDMY